MKSKAVDIIRLHFNAETEDERAAIQSAAETEDMVENCKMNDLDFILYVETVLRRLYNGDPYYQDMLHSVIILPDAVDRTTVA